MIKAIGFDWGGVLNGKPGGSFVDDVTKLLGITREAWSEAYFRHNSAANSGEISYEELYKRVSADLDKSEEFDKVWALNFASLALAPNLDVISLADRLRADGYKVGMLSNNSRDMGVRLRADGLDKHFDVFHISAETGYVKPDAIAFEHFASELDVALDELVFIDDTDKSLSTSSEIGYTPILFSDYDQLVKDLKNLDITL